MFHHPISSSHIQKTLTRTAARIAVLSLFAAFLFLAGLAYADLMSPDTAPAGQDSHIPIRNEESVPDPFAKKPVNLVPDPANFAKKPVRFFPGPDSDQAVPANAAPVQIAALSTDLVQTDSGLQSGLYTDPSLLSLLSGK